MAENQDIRFSNVNTNLEPRVSHLEGEMSQLVITVRSLADTISRQEVIQEKRDEAIHNKLDNLTRDSVERGRTDWKTIFSGLAIVITIMTIIMTYSIAPLNNEISSIKQTYSEDIRELKSWKDDVQKADTKELREIKNQVLLNDLNLNQTKKN